MGFMEEYKKLCIKYRKHISFCNQCELISANKTHNQHEQDMVLDECKC